MLYLFRLSSERAISSQSECSAIITAFMECLRYAMLQSIGEEDEQKQIQEMLIYDQVFIMQILEIFFVLAKFNFKKMFSGNLFNILWSLRKTM